LRRNIADNALDAEAVEAAVSDREGNAILTLSWSDMSASLEGGFKGGAAAREVEVRTVSLNSFVREIRLADEEKILVKIDVEGHEPRVLEGAWEFIERWRPEMLIEVSDSYGAGLLDRLKSFGYRVWEIRQDGLCETDRLELVRESGVTVLNRLLSTRSTGEIEALAKRIVPRIRGINPRRTSHYRGDPGRGHQPPTTSKA
jgi:FkbM family methyltransferase